MTKIINKLYKQIQYLYSYIVNLAIGLRSLRLAPISKCFKFNKNDKSQRLYLNAEDINLKAYSSRDFL